MLTSHVNGHFDDDVPDSKLEPQPQPQAQHKHQPLNQELEHSPQHQPQIISRLLSTLRSNSHSNSKHATTTAFLCDPYTVFFPTSEADRGWDCGYRNCQTLFSHLISSAETKDHLRMNSVPSILQLQQILENAWNSGWDVQGAIQLNHCVLNSKIWIGTTEIAAILRFLGVHCDIIDFHKPTDSGGSHPRLLEWVWDYFSSSFSTSAPSSTSTSTSASTSTSTSTQPSTQFMSNFQKTGIISTQLSPLYFQHQGHSRIIVGIERTKAGATNLLLFDPSCNLDSYIPFVSANASVPVPPSKILSKFRVGLPGLKRTQYQIVRIVHGTVGWVPGSLEERQAKVFVGVRIP